MKNRQQYRPHSTKGQVKESSIFVLILSIISVAAVIFYLVEFYRTTLLVLIYPFILIFTIISLAISFAFFITAFFDYKRNKNVTRKIELILTSIAMGLSSSAFLLLHVIFIF